MTAPHALSRTSFLLCVALLSAAGAATGCASDDTSRFYRTTVKMHAVAEPVRAIVVKAQSGDIDLVPTSARSSVRETRHYDTKQPRFTQDVTDGVLTIQSDCNAAQCEVDLRVAVPSGVKVSVDVASGNVQARAINVRDARLRSRSGNVSVDLIGQQQRIWAHTDSALDAMTDSGTLNVDGVTRDDRAPKSIVARTTSGNVSVTSR